MDEIELNNYFKKSPSRSTNQVANVAIYKIFKISDSDSKTFCGEEAQSTTQLLHGKMHRYTAKIIIREDIPRKEGLCELSLQAFINTKRKVVGLDVFVLPAEFDKEKQRIVYVKGKSLSKKKDADDLNLYLGNQYSKAQDIFMHHRLHDLSLSGREFEKQFRNTISRYNFYSYIDRLISDLNHDRAKATIMSYKNTLNKLKLFRSSVTFHELNYDFVSDFDRHIRREGKMHINSAWKIHRNIKFFINQAIKKGHPIENPYKLFKAKTVFSERPFLSTEKLQAVLDLYSQNSLSVPQQRSCRLFLFACFTGLRISDVFTITSEMLIENTLIFPMKKGRHLGKICRVPLNEMAKRFIQNNGGTLFDKISEKQVNIDLKEVASAAKITDHLSFHIGRHTFAVTFLRSGGNVQELQKILGHSNINTTMIYVHITDAMKRESVLKMDGRFKLA